jgi:hypothetical protein
MQHGMTAGTWKLVVLVLAWSALSAGPIEAQAGMEGRERPWYASVSRYGKWVSLAAAAGFVTAAAVYHRDADDAERLLTDFCLPDPAQCQLTGTGSGQRYANARAEALFQDVARIERKSRRLLVGGQVAIIAAGSMFLIDLLTRDMRPSNIPYTPLEVFSAPDRLGLSIRF